MRTPYILAIFAICLTSARARGQEGQPGAHRPGAPDAAAVTGPEKKYVELSHSKDRVIKATAERYLNLIKFQEWGGASGKSQMAKYVSHDPDLTKVKLSVVKGSGKDRVVKEFDVEVAKLNKLCQARVKQIDILQKKLDELAAADAAKTNGAGGLGPVASAAVPAAAPAGPEATPPTPAAPVADPSASEPDPLGFAELPPVSPSAAGAPPAGASAVPPIDPSAASVAPVPTKPGSSDARKQWRTNFAAFSANITVQTDPTGKQVVDWGELRELREMHDIVVAQRSPEPPVRSPEAETPAAISERLGDMHWLLAVDKVDEAPGGLVVPTFHPVELAKPLELRVALDDTEDAQKWAKLAPGSTVNVSARLSISEPYNITAKVKLADANSAPIGNAPAKPWQSDFEAFRGEFKVYPVGPGQPPSPTDRPLFRVYEGSAQQRTAEWDVDFGELDDLRSIAEVMDIAMGNRPPSMTKADLDQKIKNSKEAEKRIGEVTWEATFRKFNGVAQPIEFIKSPLPKPLDIMFTLDPQAAGSAPEQWSALARGDRIRFKGRLSMSNSSLIRVYVREPLKVGVSP